MKSATQLTTPLKAVLATQAPLLNCVSMQEALFLHLFKVKGKLLWI